MNKKLNRTISLLVVTLMLIAMLPAAVLADEGTEQEAPAPVAVEAPKEEAPAPAPAPAATDEGEAEDLVPSGKEAPAAPAAEPEAPAAEEPAPAPEAPADEDEAPADEDETPADEDETPADEDEAPADEDEAPADEDEAPAKADEDKPAPAKPETEESEKREEVPVSRNGYVAAGVAVHAEPDGESRVLFVTAEDTVFFVSVLVNNEWLAVDLNGEAEGQSTGYIYKHDVSFDAPSATDEGEAEDLVPSGKEPASDDEAAADEVVEDTDPSSDNEDLIEIYDYETPLGLEGLEFHNDDEEAEEPEEVDEAELAEAEEPADEAEPAEEAEPASEESEAEEPADEEEPEEEPEEEEPKYTVLYVAAANAGAALRTGADGMSPIIVTLAEGDALQILWQEGDWFAVLLEEATADYEIAYVYKDDIASAAEEEEPAEEVKVEVPKKVTIFTSQTISIRYGDSVTISSKLEGFDDCEEIIYVWKADKGAGFEVLTDGGADSYTFTATEETLSWTWHLTVLSR